MEKINNDSIQSLILDMDGVLWRGKAPIGDLPSVFQKIYNNNLKFVLVTNNSTLTAEQYVEKLKYFGVTIEISNVITSALATAQHLANKFPNGGPVYIIGENGLYRTLEEYGFYFSPEGPLAVVVGLDRELTYDKLRIATLLIHLGTPFFATNGDRTFPIPEGLAPGAGSIVHALIAATDVNPIVIGKPFPIMFEVALGRLGTKLENILVVGDRLETDIAGAQELGMKTGLVLSGVTSSDQAKQWKPRPDIITKDLEHILKYLTG